MPIGLGVYWVLRATTVCRDYGYTHYAHIHPNMGFNYFEKWFRPPGTWPTGVHLQTASASARSIAWIDGVGALQQRAGGSVSRRLYRRVCEGSTAEQKQTGQNFSFSFSAFFLFFIFFFKFPFLTSPRVIAGRMLWAAVLPEVDRAG